MTNFLLLPVLNSLFIVGLTILTTEGFALHFIRRWIDKHVTNVTFHTPLIGCVICMASVWGAVGFAIAWAAGVVPLWYLPVHLVVVAGLNQYFYRWS